jgi:hypothetical protein
MIPVFNVTGAETVMDVSTVSPPVLDYDPVYAGTTTVRESRSPVLLVPSAVLAR